MLTALDGMAEILQYRGATEDNIEELVAELSDIRLEKMEKNYLLMKISQLNEKQD